MFRWLVGFRVDGDRYLRWAATVFAAAVAVHGIDHLRRGMDVVPPAVMVAGTVQIVLAAVVVASVFTGSRWAPPADAVIGFISAAGFTAAHLLPTWGFFSDSFIDAPAWARVTWFSWVSAICEIVADVAFGMIGVAALRAGRTTAGSAR